MVIGDKGVDSNQAHKKYGTVDRDDRPPLQVFHTYEISNRAAGAVHQYMLKHCGAHMRFYTKPSFSSQVTRRSESERRKV